MLRRLIYGLLILIGIVVLALLALATPPGKSLVKNAIQNAASGNGLIVSIGTPTGWPPFSLGADKVIVADADGGFAEIDGLTANVDIAALLGGKLDLSAIRADRVAITRRPNIPGSGGSGAALPFAADSVQVARIELGAGLIGRAAALSLDGAAYATRGGGLHAQVAAKRIDGVAGSLTATIDRANGSAPFAIDANVSEDADGILVGLLGQPSGPAYMLAARTTVDGNSMAGTVSLSSGGAAHFAGDFTWTPTTDGASRVTAKASGDLAELVPADYADLLAGPIALSLDADWTSPSGDELPTIAVRQGALSTANVHASLSGSLNDTTADLALKLDAAKAGGGTISLPFLGAGSQVETVSVTGQVAPKDDVIRLDLMGHAAGLVVGGLTLPTPDFSLAVEAKKDAPLAGGTLPFGLRVETDAVQTADGRIESSAGAPIILTAGGTFDTHAASADANAKFSIAGGNGTFTGTASAASVKGTATAEFADLAPLSPLLGRTVSGGISFSADGTLIAPQSAFKLSATATDLDIGEPTLKRLLAGETQVTATIGAKDGGFTVDDLSLSGRGLIATGQAALADGTIVGSFKGGIADLALLADSSSGAATFTAAVNGPIARPAVDTTIGVASGQLAGKPIQNGSVRFTGAPTDSGWQGALTLAGNFAGRPLSGTADATLDAAGLFAFPKVDLSIGDNRITGAVARTASGPLSGTLNVTANDLATLAALALVNAAGKGTATIAFSADGPRQSLNATFNGSGLSYQTFSARSVSATIAVADAFGVPLVTGNATANALVGGGVHLDTANATASVQNGATHFTAAAKGTDLDLSGSGSLGQSGGATTVTLDALSGTAYRLPVKLNAPVALTFGSNASRISGAQLALGGGTLTADGVVNPALNLTIVATNVAAAVANGFVPNLNAEGAISGRATITGTFAAPQFAWQANWQGLRVAATRTAGLPPLAVTASGTGNLKTTTLSASIGGLSGLSLTVSGAVPFSGTGLNLMATGAAPLALLALETSGALRLGGTARVNLALTGALAAVATNGTIDLDGATVADADTGFGITGASGRIAFNGHQATTQQISGQMIQGGSIVIAGSVTVDAPGLPGNLTVRVSNGRYADGRMINAAFGANLAISGPILADGTVSGTIDLGRTEIQLPDKLAGSATAIPVTHVNAPPGFQPPQLRQAATSSGPAGNTAGRLKLDVALNGTSAIFVRGFGIDAEFGGSLRLTGTTGSPDTAGAFTMRRGRMEVLGRRFDFQSGTLTFAGDLVPLLDFEGTTATTDSTVTLHVTGPANDPAISFTSSPALPEEEILARLLFNQSVGKLSPLQAAQLVDAVAQLTGAVGSGGIFARIREATGLDDIDVRQSATGGTTVGLSKRISDNVEVGVEAGGGPNSGRVTIDLNLTKNLKAEVQGGQSGTGQVGLTYEREY